MQLLIDALIWLNLYWYYVTPTFAGGIYYILLNFFQFPLLTNKAHELVLILTPERPRIKKITEKYLPFFDFKKGIYWFDKPVNDVDSLNRLHVYITEINQPITKMERRDSKVNDLITNQEKKKQLSGHRLLLLRNFSKHLKRHWTLVLDPQNDMYKLSPSDVRQPLKVNFYHTLGVYIQSTVNEEREIEGSTGGGKLLLEQISTQTIITQVKYVQEHSYYSASFAHNVLKTLRNVNRNFIMWVTGSIDPKIIMMILILAAMVAGGYIFMQVFNPMSNLGEMPTA